MAGRRGLKVAFIGNLAGGALMMAAPVAKRGIETTLFLAAWEAEPAQAAPEVSIIRYGVVAPHGSGILGRILTRMALELSCLWRLPAILCADVVQSFTGSLFCSWTWIFAFGVLRLRPYIACATGSDIREVAATDLGRAGRLMRSFFVRAARVLLLNIDMVAVAERLGLQRAQFFPFAVDTGFFAPQSVPRTVGTADDLLVFMPSHLDWGVVDNAAGRSSTKGNDRFIRAFARFIGEGGKGHLLLLDRGPDRSTARELVSALGIGSHVTFKGRMSKAELRSHMNMADLIADQFDVGSFGTTALEGMACGKPVLIKIDADHAGRCYSEMPPVLNVETIDEMLAALRRMSDRDARRVIGARAREWAVRVHDENVVADRLVDQYEAVLGR